MKVKEVVSALQELQELDPEQEVGLLVNRKTDREDIEFNFDIYLTTNSVLKKKIVLFDPNR